MTRHHKTELKFLVFGLTWITAITLAIYVALKRILEERFPHSEMPSISPTPNITSRPSEPSDVNTQNTNQNHQEVLNEEPKNNGNHNGPLWDIIGLTSVAVTIVGAAIFYIAGWVYEGNWYGFYGIEISHIGLLPNQVMVQGLPGIFLVIVCLILSFTWQYFMKGINWIFGLGQLNRQEGIDLISNFAIDENRKLNVTRTEFYIIILRAYQLAYVALSAFIFFISIKGGAIPWELFFTLIPGIVIISVVSILAYFEELFNSLKLILGIPTNQNFRFLSIPSITSWLLGKLVKLLIRLPQITKLIQKEQNKLDEALSQDTNYRTQLLLFYKLADLPFEEPIKYTTVNHAMFRIFEKFFLIIKSRFTGFWLPLVLTMLFLVSISASSLLGIFDAIRGARSLSGNWQFPVTFITSNDKLISLSQFEQEVDGGYQYGPFGLVFSTDMNYYLTELKADVNYKSHPSLYVIPNKPDLYIHFIKSLPTPIQILTPTISVTPAPTSSPTNMQTMRPTEKPTRKPTSTYLPSQTITITQSPTGENPTENTPSPED